ncbi:MAG: ankyrin repeat domain-containing protein [Planctomycetes bacterium]|nr:ankyrin repeat domain-containing protein [Planctomycetota bacterium]
MTADALPLPSAMYRTQRALCPQCGAPLALQGAGATAACGFCGGASVVERRLRFVEPEVKEPVARPAPDWMPAHRIQGAASDLARCGGCGAELEVPEGEAIVRCPHCKGESKVERRMRRSPAGPVPKEEADPATERLVRAIVEDKDLATRIGLAKRFDEWCHINPTLARLLPDLLRVMRECDPRLDCALGEAICKLLCDDEGRYTARVLDAAEEVAFDAKGSRALLYNIGLGDGKGAKLLLDVADRAGRQGAVEVACQALLSINLILERNYPQHEPIAQIILYRLPYLAGPALAWAMRFAQGESNVRYRFPAKTLLQFIDDCAFERPEFAVELRKCFFDGEAKNEGDYRGRLDFYRSLRTAEARAAALRGLGAPPRGASLRLLDATLDLALPLLDDARLGEAACEVIVELLRSGSGVPQQIHALVKKKGDALPDELRRAYLERVPNAPLSRPGGRDKGKAPVEAEWERLYAQLKEGMSAAIDAWEDRRRALHDYWERIKERTPLMIAAGRGEMERVRALIAEGTPVNGTDPNGRTALMVAAEEGNAGMAAELLRLGADAGLRDAGGKSALMLAAEAGQAKMVRSLPQDESQRQDAFRLAFQGRRVEAMRVLLEDGADPDTMEEGGVTPLMIAAREGWDEIVAILLKGRARFDHQDGDGRTALLHAAGAARASAAQLLLDAGADPNLSLPSGDTPLIVAAREGHLEVVRAVAPRMRDLNARGKGGLSALSWAEKKGRREVADFLRASGANPAGDVTLLFEAIRGGKLDEVRRMLDAGFDPKAINAEGEPAVCFASGWGKLEIARLLLERGADPGCATAAGKPLIVRAAEQGRLEFIGELLARGVDANARDAAGRTALMAAAVTGQIALAKLLLDHGADAALRTAKGEGPADFARMRRDNDEMIRLLGG